jgi:hypothetical protein
MANRLRGGSTQVMKKNLKEKVLQFYEALFRVSSCRVHFLFSAFLWRHQLIESCSSQGEDPSLGNATFWDEFFLLKPKVCKLVCCGPTS